MMSCSRILTTTSSTSPPIPSGCGSDSTAVTIATLSPEVPVDIGYVRGRIPYIAFKRRTACCLCNMMIPHIMPELPDVQKRALARCVKLPLVYVNVAIRNWHAFATLGIDSIYSPSAYYSTIKLDYPVSLGGYRNPRTPDEPMVLHLEHFPLTPNQGLSNVEQFRLGGRSS